MFGGGYYGQEYFGGEPEVVSTTADIGNFGVLIS